MPKINDVWKVFRQFVQFSRASGSYWIVPLVLLLGFVALLIVASQVAAPLIYTLF